MAIIRYSLHHSSASAPVMNPNPASTRSPRKKMTSNKLIMMCASNHVSANLQISSSFPKIKVFEDRSSGIVCYRDENGEIVCEGYDEGPRFHHQIPRFTFNSRDVEIIDLLQRCWLHVAAENELETADEGAAGHTDFNCNGFNTLF